MSDELESELAPKIVEAQIVREKPAKLKKKTGSYPLTPAQIRKRDKTFSDVVVLRSDKTDWRGQLSDRERKLITVLLKTGSKQKAADEIGVTIETVNNYIKRPFVRAYLDQMRLRAAKAAALTHEKVAGVIGDAVDGKDVTPMQLQAASIAAKLLAPNRGPAITVNQQNNFLGASPFQELAPGAMLDEIKKNLLEMGHEASPDAPAGPAAP